MVLLVLALASLATVRCSSSTSVTNAADYYAGKTLRIIVPFGPGGSYDLQARILAQRLRTYLPGQPTVVVENIPGAGGLVGTRYVARRARPDGLTIGMLSAGFALRQPAQDSKTDSALVDISRFVPIGSPTPGVSVCIFRADSRFRDVKTWIGSATPPKIGMAGSPASGYDVAGPVLIAALGLPIRPVRGYAGSSEIRQAIDVGEIDGTCLTQEAFRVAFVPNENYALAIQDGTEVSNGLEDVPLALTLTDDPDAQALLRALALMRSIDRFYALPPGTPDELASHVRRAFLRTMDDPVFRQTAANARLSIDPMSGQEVSAGIAALLALSDETRDRIAQIVSPVSP